MNRSQTPTKMILWTMVKTSDRREGVVKAKDPACCATEVCRLGVASLSPLRDVCTTGTTGSVGAPPLLLASNFLLRYVVVVPYQL